MNNVAKLNGGTINSFAKPMCFREITRERLRYLPNLTRMELGIWIQFITEHGFLRRHRALSEPNTVRLLAVLRE